MSPEKKSLKQILVVTYYFPPLTGAPAWRSYSWARFFDQFGYSPTILTRHWSGNETTWDEHINDIEEGESFEQFDTYSIYRVNSKKAILFKFFNKLKIPFIRKIYFALLQLFGYFNTEVNAYLTFKVKLIELIQTNKYTTIIFTGPPPNIYRLVNIVKKYSSAKVILDFRDLNNNAVISKSVLFSIRWKIINSLFSFHETKWMNKADLITTVAPAFKEYLQKRTKTKVELIYNGFDNDYFDQIEKKLPEKFTISIVGAIYPLQNYSMILNGLQDFLKHNNSINIQVNGIGVLMVPEVANDFKSKLLDSRVYLSNRVPKSEAVAYVKNAHCLLFTAWDDRPGMIPAKFFDYLASKTFIINSPGDGDIIDRFLLDSGMGVTINNYMDLSIMLEKKYQDWFNNLNSDSFRNNDFIQQFSRKNQAKIILDMIQKLHLF